MLGNSYKIHCDSSQFIGVRNDRIAKPVYAKKKSCDFNTIVFDVAFNECMHDNMIVYKKEDYECTTREQVKYNKKAFDFIKEYFDNQNIDVSDKFIIKNINRRLFNIFLRVKRLKRKVMFHSRTFYWNYFVTLTRDDKKYPDYESWLHAVKYSLSKFAYRRGWKYVFVVEKGDLNGREHLHGLIHVPAGQMVGDFYTNKTYNRKTGQVKINNMNTFFSKFGINDFEKIRYMGASTQKHILNYITKYVSKSVENFIFSRGLKEGLTLRLNDNQVFGFCPYDAMRYIVTSDIDCYSIVMNAKAKEYELLFYQRLTNNMITSLNLATA